MTNNTKQNMTIVDYDTKDQQVYILRLFVAGASPNSTRAIANLKKICEAYLSDRYELEVIDVHQQPEKAQHEQLIALPLLIKRAPGNERRLVGDMSDKEKVLRGLGLK